MNEIALFRKYQKMILGQAHALSNRYGVEFDDIVSQGYLIFVKTLHTFDPKKSSFGTYLYNNLHDLNNYCKKQRRYNEHLKIVEEEMLIDQDKIRYDTFCETLIRIKENKELSDKSIAILQYVLSREWDLPDKNFSKRKVSFSMVVRHFSPMKYHISELHKSWEEIRKWWGTYYYAY